MLLPFARLSSTRPDHVRSSGKKHSCQSFFSRFQMLLLGARSKRSSESSSAWTPSVTSGDKNLCNSDRVATSRCRSSCLTLSRHFSSRAADAAAMADSQSRMLKRIRIGKSKQATSKPATQLAASPFHPVTPVRDGTQRTVKTNAAAHTEAK